MTVPSERRSPCDESETLTEAGRAEVSVLRPASPPCRPQGGHSKRSAMKTSSHQGTGSSRSHRPPSTLQLQIIFNLITWVTRRDVSRVGRLHSIMPTTRITPTAWLGGRAGSPLGSRLLSGYTRSQRGYTQVRIRRTESQETEKERQRAGETETDRGRGRGRCADRRACEVTH